MNSWEQFEAWISAPPFEKSTARLADDAASAWPGHYRSYEVQLAWEAWQASRHAALTEAVEAVRDRGGDNEEYHAEAILALRDAGPADGRGEGA